VSSCLRILRRARSVEALATALLAAAERACNAGRVDVAKSELPGESPSLPAVLLAAERERGCVRSDARGSDTIDFCCGSGGGGGGGCSKSASRLRASVPRAARLRGRAVGVVVAEVESRVAGAVRDDRAVALAD